MAATYFPEQLNAPRDHHNALLLIFLSFLRRDNNGRGDGHRKPHEDKVLQFYHWEKSPNSQESYPSFNGPVSVHFLGVWEKSQVKVGSLPLPSPPLLSNPHINIVPVKTGFSATKS